MNDKVIEIYNKVRKLDICRYRGLSNPIVSERQFLYGDISDFIRDNYPELSSNDKEILARLLIGDYVVMNCLL